MGHVGEQKLRKNCLFENGNVDAMGHVCERQWGTLRVVIGAETMENTSRPHLQITHSWVGAWIWI